MAIHGAGIKEARMRFNGIDPREISPKIFPAREIIQAIPPRSIRTLSTSNGSIYAGEDLKPRTIRVTVNFAGSSHENANELVRELNRHFCTGTIGELEPTHMPGMAFSVVLVGASDLEWKWGFGTIDYEFQALRPYMHSVVETVVSFSGSRRIEPRGSVPIRPHITHSMAEAAAQLTISQDGVAFFRLRPLTGTFSSGTKLMIDFENRLVRSGTEAAMELVDYTVSDWHPNIKKGSLITISDTGGQTEVRWRDEWM